MTTELKDMDSQPLWPILVETVHGLTMYKYHKRYIFTVVIKEKPEITPKELSLYLRIPLGEAMVILHELGEEQAAERPT